jgi:IS30 family transposase
MRVIVQPETLVEWESQGLSHRAIAKLAGISITTVERRIRNAQCLPGPDDPDQATIEARAAEIRAGWSEKERRRRMCMKGTIYSFRPDARALRLA